MRASGSPSSAGPRAFPGPASSGVSASWDAFAPLPTSLSRGGRLRAAVPEPAWYEVRASLRRDRRFYEFAKRCMDLALCLAALPVLLPLLALCALALRLDSPGPVFFSQARTGRGGRRFRMYKLRTMVRNAEELKQEYAHLNELSWPDFKITNDPRVTRVGRFLRRTSLDELPQIVNVLRGDMSLVGPRPTSFSADTYSLWHTARLEVKPGLTGLWQVSGRNELDFDDRLRLDIAYIRNRSLTLDLMLLLRTVTAVTTGRGAN
jgi:lipopolysaccharide/colanic/teichoic acid biosynthesis glycosyltransferase